MVIKGPFGADAAAADEVSTDETDGRRLRRDRNRDAVVEALLTLYGEGNLDPSSAEIAERAGLSPRSLFRYFDDIDDLCRAAVVAQIQRVKHLFDIPVDATHPLTERIAALVEQRLSLYEAIEPAATVSRLRAPFQPVLADELAITRAALRKQVRDVMTPELEAMETDRAETTLSAMDVLCSFESYQLMRGGQHLTGSDIAATLTAALAALLTPTNSTGQPVEHTVPNQHTAPPQHTAPSPHTAEVTR